MTENAIAAAPVPAPPRWKAAAARAVYSALMRLALPVLVARAWSRGRVEPVYAQRWPERLALGYPHAAVPAQAASPLIWLHAVSLGETRACAPLVKALRDALPGMRLLLTCTTATGWTAGEALLQPGDIHTWMPFDTPGAVRRFLRHHRPRLAVLMETEVWPNVQREAQRAGLPVVLANARLSDKSLRQGRRFAALLQPAAAAITEALAQTADDARRLTAMGVPRVQVCGNLKFDVHPNPQQVGLGRDWAARLQRPVVLFASSREGEEAPMLQAWVDQTRQLPQPRPLFLLVPRHPQRFDEVARLVQNCGLSMVRRSSWAEVPGEPARGADVWLGDSMGEMPLYYGAANVCLLGGSFEPLGGQNLIESVACGCPVVMGPSTFNFAEAAQLCEDEGVATRVEGPQAAVAVALRQLQQHNGTTRSAGRDNWMLAHKGSAQRMAQAVLSRLT